MGQAMRTGVQWGVAAREMQGDAGRCGRCAPQPCLGVRIKEPVRRALKRDRARDRVLVVAAHALYALPNEGVDDRRDREVVL